MLLMKFRVETQAFCFALEGGELAVLVIVEARLLLYHRVKSHLERC